MPLTLSSQFNEFKHIRNYSAITTVLCLNIVIIFKKIISIVQNSFFKV